MGKFITQHGEWKIACGEDGRCEARLAGIKLKALSLSAIRAAIEDHEKKEREAERRLEELRQHRSSELKR